MQKQKSSKNSNTREKDNAIYYFQRRGFNAVSEDIYQKESIYSPSMNRLISAAINHDGYQHIFKSDVYNKGIKIGITKRMKISIKENTKKSVIKFQY